MKYLIYSLMLLSMLICSFVYPQKNVDEYIPTSTMGTPVRAYLNLNNISTIFKNTGISDISVGQYASGFVYPFGTGKTAIYCSGLIWGVKIAGDPQVRVGGSAYREGLQSGWIDQFGNVIPQDDPSVRIWRVRPDVFPGGPFVDLSREAIDEVKSIQEIRDQYELDWVQWPGIIGAPYTDIDEDGSYDPSVDIPGMAGATQTIWFVANDQSAARTTFMYGTLPVGIEYQATMWEYKDSLGFDNLFFRKYKLINKSDILGNPNTFDSMYISMWSDPDIGDSQDDYVGCDTILNLGFGYNASGNDLIYGDTPPAIGFDLIRGPLVPGNPGEDRNRNGVDDINDTGLTEDNQRINGFINLPMTAFYYFTNQDPLITDPIQGSSEGATQFYNFMQGKIGLTGEYFINPITNLPTTFALPGDPVNGTGWIDGIQQGPGDRRLGLSTGPIVMAPGDTQTVVVAEIAGGADAGVSYLDAISLVKYYSQIAQEFYDAAFPSPVSVNNDVDLPINFKLNQNYPNPFNPSTKISWQVPVGSHQTLKIYDLLGNEVAALVDEFKPAGSYEFVFNSASHSGNIRNLPAGRQGLTSGIYFYRLQAGEFIETKKMILLR